MVAGIRLRRWVLAGLLLLAGASVASGMTIQPAAVQSGRPVLLLQGRIVPGDAARLRAALAGVSPRVAGLVLNSPGGSVLEAQDMAKLIRDSGAAVLVPANAVCASACFMLFAAARNKLVEPGAMVGVHSASVAGGNETMDTLGVTTLMARSAASYGVPSAITGRMVTTRPGQMAWLTRTELESMGTRVVAGSSGAASNRVAPGSARGAQSDWTRGFEHGQAGGEGASCTPPAGIGDPADWTLGCESGRRAQTAAVAGPRSVPARGGSDWSRGFDYGRTLGGGAACAAPPPGIAAAEDWTLGCQSGRRAAAAGG